MEINIVGFVFLFIFWIICNLILKIFLKEDKELNDFNSTILKDRKKIMFDLISLIFFLIVDWNVLTYVGIVYNIIILILCSILLVISLVTGIDDDIKNKSFNKDLWLMFSCNLLNCISSGIVIMILFNILN